MTSLYESLDKEKAKKKKKKRLSQDFSWLRDHKIQYGLITKKMDFPYKATIYYIIAKCIIAYVFNCIHYDTFMESANHLFFEVLLLETNLAILPLSLPPKFTIFWHDNNANISSWICKKLNIIALAILWCLWTENNNRVFKIQE